MSSVERLAIVLNLFIDYDNYRSIMKFSLKHYIKNVRWRRAKDGTQEYTVMKWKPELEKEFRKFVSIFYDTSYKEKFSNTTCTYLTIDGYTNWTMNYRVDATILINRKIEG